MDKEFNTYEANVKLCEASFDEVIKRAEDLISNRENPQVLPSQGISSSGSKWKLFRPQNNLAPCVLERSTDHLEVTKFTQCLKMYIKAGFHGSPWETNIFIYTQPFITSTWWAALSNRGVRKKESWLHHMWHTGWVINQEHGSWQKRGPSKDERKWDKPQTSSFPNLKMILTHYAVR